MERKIETYLPADNATAIIMIRLLIFNCLIITLFISAFGTSALAAKKAENDLGRPVIVASKADTESRILGHIISEALKDAGVEVEARIGSGDTVALRQAVKTGEIDIYPEYVGLGALMYPTIEASVWKNPEEAFQTLKETDHIKNGLIWLKAAPADAGWRIAVRKDFALEHGLKGMSDFARYVSDGGEVRLAACRQFVERADVLPAFQRVYGFMLEPENFVMLDSCDTAKAEKVLAEAEQGVNFSMAFGTDPALKEFLLIPLDDGENSQVAYQPSPVARGEVVEALPQLKQLLTPIFGALTSSTLRSLNAAVLYDGMSPREAAGAYLQSHGFIKLKKMETEHETGI